MEGGFTYLGVLAAIAVMGIGATAASELWAASARRQQLEQLDWVGHQFEQAIRSYYEASPGGWKRFPKTLNDLIEDRRYATVRRHLRRVYVNPLTNAVDWELVSSPDGGFRAVRVALPKVPDEVQALREYGYAPTAP